MFRPGSTPPTSAPSPVPDSASDPPTGDLDSIATQWKELAESDQGDVISSRLSRTKGDRLSLTVKLRDEKAVIALEA